jgi:general secretion pathway protein J
MWRSESKLMSAFNRSLSFCRPLLVSSCGLTAGSSDRRLRPLDPAVKPQDDTSRGLQDDRRKNGFTLLEILIALFIFTILSMIMVAGLHSIITSQSATQKRAERMDDLQFALMIMSRDFEQTVNRPITDINGPVPAMMGYPTTVIFSHGGLANPLGQLSRSSLQRTQYLLEKGKLLRVTWPVLDHSAKIKPDQRVLLTNVSELRFQYLDPQKKFRDSWPPPDKQDAILPIAIRVILTLPESGKITQLYVIPVQTLDQKTGNASDKKT